MSNNYGLILELNDEHSIHLDFKSGDLKEKNKKWEIDKIALEYFSDKELSSITVDNLKNNYTFKVELLKNLKTRMENIFIDDSIEVYKELITIINLLSYGERYHIFIDYNKYSTDEISKLFSNYQSLLIQSSQEPLNEEGNNENFELNFNYFITLLEAFKELCIINLIDVVRKKTIQGIINVITESLNMIKFTVVLDETKVAILNTFQGELLLSFSNISYISIKNKDINTLISEYKFIYNKQVDGYHMSSNNNFNANNNDKHTHYLTFLSITTNLLLLLLLKLEKYKDISFDIFEEIIDIYTKETQINDVKIASISEFKESLLNNLVYLYDKSLSIKHQDLVKHILDKNDISVFNMKIIHNMILFSSLHENNLIFILRHILKVAKMNNDFHEYHKLRIIDSIINKFIRINGNINFTKQIPLILDYMKNANTASNLMSVFSKIRLSLSHYFSFLGKVYLTVSQEQYFIGEKVCSYTLIKNEYKSIYENILLNNAQEYFKSLSLSPRLDRNALLIFGEKMMQDFFVNKEIKNKYDVNISFDNIVEYILISKNKTLSTIEEHISTIISQKIFFNLAVCKVVDIQENYVSLEEVGYEIFEQNIFNGYKIVYKYSYSYNESFHEIFKSNESYIKKSVTNILLSYLNLE